MGQVEQEPTSKNIFPVYFSRKNIALTVHSPLRRLLKKIPLSHIPPRSLLSLTLPLL